MNGRFDIIFDTDRSLRYYYNRLKGDQKIIYRLMYDTILSVSPEITIPGTVIDIDEITQIIKCIKDDNPKLFWMSNDVNVIWSSDSTTVRFNYTYDRQEITELKERLERSLRSFVDRIKGNNISEYDLELAAHDLLSEKISYDTSDRDSHCIVGPMLRKTGVCEGISLALKYILDSIGIRCIVMTGKLRECDDDSGHMWNIVEISDRMYHVDVTNNLKMKNIITSHRYFNQSDRTMNNTHTWSSDIRCDSIEEDYFHRNGLNFRTMKEAEMYLRHGGHRGTVEFKVVGCYDSGSMIKMISGIEDNCRVHSNKNSDVYIIEYKELPSLLKRIVEFSK